METIRTIYISMYLCNQAKYFSFLLLFGQGHYTYLLRSTYISTYYFFEMLIAEQVYITANFLYKVRLLFKGGN